MDGGHPRAFATALAQREAAWRGEVGYSWRRYKPMLERYGAVGVAKRQVIKPGTSPGFEKLKAAGRLDLTIEALILDPAFVALFTLYEQAAARNRLVDHGRRG